MTRLRRLYIVLRLLIRNLIRGLTGGRSPGPVSHEEFAAEVDALMGAASEGAIDTARVWKIPASEPPWRDTGIDIEPGDCFSTFVAGRTWFAKPLDLWVKPEFHLWYRIGEDGDIARGARATNTITALSSGRLYIGGVVPGDWADPQGGLAAPSSVYKKADGDVSVAVVKWKGDAQACLKAIAEKGSRLASDELDRMANEITTPEGWSYLWELGKGEIYDAAQGDGPAMCCHTSGDVGILQKDVDIPLTPGTRLKWNWKVDVLPSQFAEDTVPTHDYLSIAVEFDNGRDLTWYWSSKLPVGMSYHCPLPNWAHRETHYVIRSGSEGLGEWFAEDRNIYDDYVKAIGEPPARIVRVWFIAVSVFQRGEGKCEYSDITIENEGQLTRVLEG